MDSGYLRRLFKGMSEDEAREFLIEAYENQGWTVKDLHTREPRFEEGADLRLEREGVVWLVQVKKRPVNDDLPQLAKLAQRDDAGARYYCFLEQPTEYFRKGSEEYTARVEFLGPHDLHRLLVENESTGYLLRVFETHPLIQDMARVLATIWKCRRNRQDAVGASPSELHVLWDMKDATLKLRSSLAILNLEWDDLMNRTSKDRQEFPQLLDKAIRDLNLVRRWVADGPFVAFERAEQEMPHLLGSYWSIVRQRTYWEMFTHLTENASTAEDVEHLATRFWLVPSDIPLTRQEHLKDSIGGFYSGLAHVFENLANVATDLERGIDWVWSDRTSGTHD